MAVLADPVFVGLGATTEKLTDDNQDWRSDQGGVRLARLRVGQLPCPHTDVVVNLVGILTETSTQSYHARHSGMA